MDKLIDMHKATEAALMEANARVYPGMGMRYFYFLQYKESINKQYKYKKYNKYRLTKTDANTKIHIK